MSTEMMLSPENQVALNHQIDIYKGASMLVITEEEQKKLTAPFDRNLVEIRPDGLIYLPQVFWRGRLNETFGIGQWCWIPKNVTKDPAIAKLYIDSLMMIRGHYVSTAVGEAEYHENNPKQSWASTWESAKSDSITRCCKDLGIASELWQPEFIRQWISEFAIKVFVEDNQTKKTKVAWRKKTAAPFWNEKGQNQQQPQDQSSQNKQGASAYNHKNLEKKGKPLISNEQFKKSCDRLRGGEVDVYDKTIQSFSLTPEQISLLDSLKANLNQLNRTDEPIDRVAALWSAKVDKCNSIEELNGLFVKNQLTIEANEVIKHLFTARKIELQKK